MNGTSDYKNAAQPIEKYIQPFLKGSTFLIYKMYISIVSFDSLTGMQKIYILNIFSERQPFWKRVYINN